MTQPAVAPTADQLAQLQAAHRMVCDREREATKDDGQLFAKVFLSRYMHQASPPFHGEMFRIILKEGAEANEWVDGVRGCAIAAPRGHAKSTVASLAVPLKWACHKEKRFVVMVSNTDQQADSMAQALRMEFEDNEHIKEVFGNLRGDRFKSDPFVWNKQDFTIAHTDPPNSNDRRDVVWTTRFVVRGMFGKLRGLRSRDARPDALILDDCENDEHVRTPEQRVKTWDFFTKALLPMLDPATGIVVVVGTILHYDSLLAKCLRYGPTGSPHVYVTRLWRAIDQNTGTILWPERFNEKSLGQLRALGGGQAFSSEYLNEPVDPTARKFRPEWIQWYTKDDLAYDPDRKTFLFKGAPLTVIQGVDVAIEEKQDKAVDETAIVVIGVTPSREALVLYVYHDRIDFPAQLNMVRSIYDAYRPATVAIDAQAYQAALSQMLTHEDWMPVRQMRNTTPKYERITAMSLPFERSKVFFRACTIDEPGGVMDDLQQYRVHHYVYDLYEQLMKYPSHAHDDMPDSLCNAMTVAAGERGFTNWF